VLELRGAFRRNPNRIGAIGVSGATGSQDNVVSLAGQAAVK
jgi:uncharacterized protein GlcG (DUF336 family)